MGPLHAFVILEHVGDDPVYKPVFDLPRLIKKREWYA